MGIKQEKDLSREDLAAYLETLADGLRRGLVEMGGRHWTVPTTIRARIRLKEKKGRFKTKVSWRWSSLGDYDASKRRAVEQWRQSLQASKKKMDATFKTLKKAAAQNHLPTPEQVAAFKASSLAFAAFAEPDWQEAMDEFNDHLTNLVRAVQMSDMQGVQHELRDLQARMKACHRLFK